MSTLTLVTRTSPLALWQAEHVRTQLLSHYPDLTVKLLPVKTLGDKLLDVHLDKIGGKGVFVKELQQALLTGEADLAVHSLKDVPAFFPEGLGLAAICERENPFDAWVCPSGHTLATLPGGARVGTSSLRRMVQLKRLRSDLEYVPLRGNVDTRLRKCLAKEWDAIVLAVAGLNRLGLQQHITEVFSAEKMLPAVGQGALGIECRIDDQSTRAMVKVLNNPTTQFCVEAERSMNAALGGSCQVPVAGFAQLENNKLTLTGRVGDPHSAILLEATVSGLAQEAKVLGEVLAEKLIQQGAREIIAKLSCGP